MTYLPLKGVKVLDLARLIPGGLATRRLADLGADVVKVEEPGSGDYLRIMAPFVSGAAVMHWCLNRNKQSVDIDLKTPEGLALFNELAEVADVIVEVSIPGNLARMGLDFEAMRTRRPELVVCSITGFGQTGDFRVLPSHGMNMDALAACMPTRFEDGRKVIDFGFGTSLASELGAANAALAIVAAVVGARSSGQGAWIDVSCWDAAVEMRRLGLTRQAAQGLDGLSSAAENAALYALYTAGDDAEIVFCAIELRFWTRFCEGVGRPDLIARWQGPAGGVDFRTGDDELRRELEAIFMTADGATWHDRFSAWSVPGCEVMDPLKLLSSPHFVERGLMEQGEGPMPVVLDPIRWVEGGRPGQGAKPPPSLGEHRTEILSRWLGR